MANFHELREEVLLINNISSMWEGTCSTSPDTPGFQAKQGITSLILVPLTPWLNLSHLDFFLAQSISSCLCTPAGTQGTCTYMILILRNKMSLPIKDIFMKMVQPFFTCFTEMEAARCFLRCQAALLKVKMISGFED